METIKAFGLQNRFPSPIQFSRPHSSAAAHECGHRDEQNTLVELLATRTVAKPCFSSSVVPDSLVPTSALVDD
jgi:hypothetical protein